MGEVIGILGGSFDPIHIGHLVLAASVREQLGADRVLFVPNNRSPLKSNGPVAAFAHRAAMIRLALDGMEGFGVSEIEGLRGGASFTIHTLQELRREHPHAQLWLAVGADALSDFHLWKDHDEVLELAHLAAVSRDGVDPQSSSLPVRTLSMPSIDISSTMIRERLHHGQSIAFLVPPAVSRYIDTQGLYRP